MHKLFVGLAVVFALALLSGPVAAESGVLTLSGGQESVVATMTLSAGDVVDWTYSSGGVTFTIRNGATEVFSTATLLGTGKFTAPSNGQYTFSFTNNGGSLTIVSYDVKRPFPWGLVLAGVGIGAGAIVGIGGFAVYRKRKVAKAPAAWPAQMAPPPPQ